MKIFQTIQICFKVLDIRAPSLSNGFHRFTLRNSFFCILAVLNILSSVAYGLFEAETVFEYFESIHTFLGIAICSTFFAMFLWKMDNVFRLIVDFENQIKKRKFIAMQICCRVFLNITIDLN